MKFEKMLISRELHMFIGRRNELNMLEESYKSDKSELVVIYGRRRIGKSRLVKEFGKDKSHFFSFEALENSSMAEQMNHFVKQMSGQINDPFINNINFDSWHDIFSYLTTKLIKNSRRQKKLVVFFDEIQWMAGKRSTLISLIKYFWDKEWKDQNIMLIMCGSIASFMIDKVINSKALYGRMTMEMHLKGLQLNEIPAFFSSDTSNEEIIKYISVFGTVPKYFEMIDKNRSFEQNINKLCFSGNAVMITEMEKIFYSQFQEAANYIQIVNLLKKGMLNLKEISEKTGMPSGGGLKRYIENLEKADIVKSFVPWNKKSDSKIKKYSIIDEFLNFYFRYIEPNKVDITGTNRGNLFKSYTSDSFAVWLGLAFEKMCVKHSIFLADIMGFKNEVASSGSHFSIDNDRFQVDLIYKRFDKVVTICEIKHHTKELSAEIIKEMERKKQLLKIPRGYSVETALISTYGPDKSLKSSGYFNHFVTAQDIFSKR
jgi:AAA+ ATPase superfamily predicted ATPase